MEGIVWGECSWREEIDQSFDGFLTTEILTPSDFDFVEERGHTYSSLGTREYMLPCDDSWILAEELLHRVLHDLVLEKKFLLGSIANFKGRVLDVGTGIGLWAIDMADDNPRADVIGVDLSPIQPIWVPPNCSFIIDDVELLSGLAFASSDYYPNVIHCGNMTMAIYGWTSFISWIKRELQSGGFVEFQELLWCPCVEQGGTIIPDTGPLAGFFLTLAEAFSAVGINVDAPRHLRAELELSGFKDVSQQDFLVPLGNWPKDPPQKKTGAGFYKFPMQAIELLSNRVLRRGLNYRPGKAKLWARQLKETLRGSRGEMILFKFIVVHGRKSRAIQ
ncbi:PNP-UDP-1 domain-containing protein [Fusarium sp. LHS14.1]|nr:PNP-UDP-1 domain-containing protein [Fusarium sp. LHS14.1]